MTYQYARRWLAKIGGEVTIGSFYSRASAHAAVIVSVKSAKGELLQRHSFFDDTTHGVEREMAFRRAFVVACMELKTALA